MSLRAGLGLWNGGLAGRTYYYVRTRDARSVGGPYITLVALRRGFDRAAKKHGGALNLVAQRLVDGRWYDLTEAEWEAAFS